MTTWKIAYDWPGSDQRYSVMVDAETAKEAVQKFRQGVYAAARLHGCLPKRGVKAA